jgi:exodeoxyribonuclease VII small subunit
MIEKKNKNSFEKNISRLQEISELLENENIGLDMAISLYEEGVNLSKSCIEELKKAELRITQIKASAEEIYKVKTAVDQYNGEGE